MKKVLLKVVIPLCAILLVAMVAVKFIYHPQPTGSLKKLEVSFKGIGMEFYQPQDYFDGLSDSPNLRVKEAFEKGVNFKKRFEFSAAIKEFEKALTFQPTDEEKGALFILIGNCLYSLSKYDEANDYYKKGMILTKKVGDRAGLATTYNNIGGIYYAQGNYAEALKWYEKSMKIKEEIGDRAGLATTYNNIGEIYRAQGNYAEALKWYEKSMKILRQTGNKHELAVVLKNIGLLYQQMDKKEEAKEYLQESQKLFKELGLEK